MLQAAGVGEFSASLSRGFLDWNKLVALPGGKCGLQLDNGQYAGRCNQCSPGATVDDIVAIKDANTSSVHTQFEMVIVTPASAAAAAGGGGK